MIDLLVAFMTGLTTGGLSCLAVQGGLLASSLANQVEHDLQQPGARSRKQQKQTPQARPQLAQPILLFLLAKLFAYTVLGFLLGALGSVLQLTPIMRAVLMFAIGIFMVGNGLRMLNVHPIFRFFAFEPPKALTRFIRRKAKAGASSVTSLFLGAFTVFIPCGITQSMMAVAVGTGDPLQGAMLMAAFTLGTSPVFFAVAYFATRLGSVLEKYFTRLIAATVIILGFISIDSGLNLAGSPISFSSLVNAASSTEAAPPAAVLPPSGPEPTTPSTSGTPAYTINVKNFGYEPKVLRVAANTPLKLDLVTNNVRSCALAFVIPALNYEKMLPTTGKVTIDIPPQPKGMVMRYACSMGMYTGQIMFN